MARSMPLALLCAGDNPPVAIADRAGARALPLLLPGHGAFDGGLLRAGYVVAKVGYLPVAIEDGRPLRGTALPEAWRIAPSVNPEHVLVDRYFGRSKDLREPSTIDLVDRTGRVLRTCQTRAGNLVGELASGELVSASGLFDWRGKVAPIARTRARLGGPFGEILAVVAGRYLLTAPTCYAKALTLIDTRGGRRIAVRRRGDDGLYGADYDVDASAAAFAVGDDGVLVAHGPRGAAAAAARCIGLGFSCASVLWLHDGTLLALGDERAAVVDPVTAAIRPITLARHCHPRLDVTGRLSVDEVAASIAPARTSPISAAERRRLLAHERRRIGAAARSAGLTARALAPHLVPAVRLRTVPSPRPPAATQSHLGGRPAVPAGFRWPSKEGAPYTFLAQLRCDELRAAVAPARARQLAIPGRGLVLIFVALEADGMYPRFEADSVWATYVDAAAVRPATFPRRLDAALRLPSVALSLEPCWTVPDGEVPAGPRRRGGLGQAQAEALREALDVPGPRHQAFGHAWTEQGSATPPGHELFLQLDSDGLLDVMFGDGGRLHLFRPAAMALRPSLAALTVELDCG